jgi:hypothetical protein
LGMQSSGPGDRKVRLMPKKQSTSVQPGDVYAVKLPDGRFAAVRVLQTAGKSSLVSPEAYEQKTRDDFDYSTGCGYETFSNPEGRR